MKKNLFLIILLIVPFISCDNSSDSILNIEGQYIGIFERNGSSSNVELNLENQDFSGASERVKFPAICNGKYNISGNTITFENRCPWTTEFDWSLILSDTWNYSFADNTLILTKSNGDKYILKKR